MMMGKALKILKKIKLLSLFQTKFREPKEGLRVGKKMAAL